MSSTLYVLCFVTDKSVDFRFCRYERSDVRYGNFEITALVTVDDNILFVEQSLAETSKLEWNTCRVNPDATTCDVTNKVLGFRDALSSVREM